MPWRKPVERREDVFVVVVPFPAPAVEQLDEILRRGRCRECGFGLRFGWNGSREGSRGAKGEGEELEFGDHVGLVRCRCEDGVVKSV